jgi:HK97 family phage major capsid protein
MLIDEIRNLDIAGIEERAEAIEAEMTADGADLDALMAETEALEARKKELAEQAEQRKAEEAAALEVTETTRSFEEPKKEEIMYPVESREYRDAWTKALIGREMYAEERAALSSAGAVIPTMTVNAIWDRLIKPAELLSRVDVSQFPTYVRFPVATTVGTASGQAIGTTITESSDVIGYVDLTPQEYVKLLTVKADIEHMAIDAVHDWIVSNLTDSIRYAMNKDVLIGSNTNAFKGIAGSVSANATAIPASVTKASILGIMAALPAAYHPGAVWIMTPNMFYSNIMSLTQLNDYVIEDGFSRKLFGHDVILMSEALISSKETIFFGDPKAYKVNVFKALEVKAFETATTTNIQFRGATLADGELLDTSAFVRFAQT